MKKLGIVVARDKNLATVEVYNNTNCLTCKQRKMDRNCHSCPDFDEKSPLRIVAVNDCDAQIGDKVVIRSSNGQKLILALVSFVIPAAFAFVSYMCMSMFTDDEPLKSRVALISALAAVMVAGLYSYKVSKNICEHKIISIENED
jgi:positive regulator of sigma E activity